MSNKLKERVHLVMDCLGCLCVFAAVGAFVAFCIVFFGGENTNLAAKLAIAAFLFAAASCAFVVYHLDKTKFNFFSPRIILPDEINITIKSPEDSDF